MNKNEKQEILLVIDAQKDFGDKGSLGCPGADAKVPYIAKLMSDPRFCWVIGTQDSHPVGHVSFASTHGLPVFTTAKIAHPEHGDWTADQMLWPVHCVEGTPGADFQDGIPVEKFSMIQRKGQEKFVDSYSGLYDNAFTMADGKLARTSLELSYLFHGSPCIVHIVGIATDVCVLNTVKDIFYRLHKQYLTKSLAGDEWEADRLIEDELGGWEVHVHADGCTGVTPEGHEKALEEMAKMGAKIIRSIEVEN
jgi:nicotinamidase/pyrazinamidase